MTERLTTKSGHALLSAMLLGLVSPALLAAQSAPGFVNENGSEFHTLADVNGDGIPDLVLVQKSGGTFRIAEGQEDGSLIWRTNPGDSGLDNVTGFSTGPVIDPERSQLVLSSPLDNRIQIIDTPEDRRSTEPRLLMNQRVGPRVVTALNVPGGTIGTFTSTHYDIAYHATLHDPAQPNILQVCRNEGNGLPFDLTKTGNSTSLEPRRANRIVLEDGQIPFYGVMQDEDPGTGFRLLDPTDGLDSLVGSLNGLADNAAYVYADFDGDSLAEFVFFVPGSAQLFESEWTESGPSALTSFNYPVPVAELRVVDSTGRPELLVIRQARDSADRVAYDGAGAFNIEESFSAADAPIRGAVSIDEQLHLLEGDESSSTSRSYAFDGSVHQFTEALALPELLPTEPAASLLLFDAAPLTDPGATLLGRLNAGPWTSAFTLGASSIEVVNERFQSTAGGLGDARTETLNELPAGTAGALPNQLADDNSLLFQDPAVGRVIGSLRISPPSGSYDRALRPEFELQGEGDIFYRTSTRIGNWTSVNDIPPVILEDTTLYAVALNSAGFSNVVQADYVITGNPGTRDSNGDGLPDFAAVQNGLDPLASSEDADGDGFTNFQEVLAGTDPTNGASFPARSNVSFEYPNSFDLIAAPGIPEPGNPVNPLRSFGTADPDPATGIRIHQPGGLLLDTGYTMANATLGYPAGTFEALDVVNDELFLVAASDDKFQVDDAGIARNYGRQVAALVKIPELEFAPFNYDGFGDNGGYVDLGAETSDWRTAAKNYFNNLQRPEIVRDPLGPESTLELLLVELILARRLYAEGLSDRTELTLTPFRSEEDPLDAIPVGEPVPDPTPAPERDRKLNAEILEARKKELRANDQPFYDVEGIIETVRTELTAASTTGIQQLKALAERLYTVSATSSGAALRQPLPALRQFIRVGHLANTGYDDSPANANFPSTLLSEASNGVNQIAGAISPRQTDTVTLYVDSGPTGSCPTWKEVFYTAGSFDPDNPLFTGVEYALRDDQGDPYPLARAFPLTAGSVVQVSGYVLQSAPCGDIALEVIPRPDLLFLRNASASDQDGDLIPDSIEERNPGASFQAFADTDGDGYSDLQEILDGSDPGNPDSIPTEGGVPAPVADVDPPQLKISPGGTGTAAIDFDYPAKYAPYIQFELYRTSDLNSPFSPTGTTANHLGSGKYEQVISTSGDEAFHIFRMQLK